MILSCDQFLARPADLRADVCIVGAGPVGLELAAALARSSRRVVVLERRADGAGPAADRVSRVRESGRKLARPAHGAGGWSGEWRVPDPGEWDFRPWLGPEGAPLAWADVEPFARQVMADHEVPSRVFDEAPAWRERPDVSGLAVSRTYLEQVPGDLCAARARIVAEAANVLLVTGAIAVELLPAPGGGTVGEVALRGSDGKVVRLPAEVVVLAGGPIDSVRLMLLSTRFGGMGPGNLGGHLGRGLVDHLEVPLGVVTPGKKAAAAGLGALKRFGAGSARTQIILAPDRRQSLGLPAHAVICQPRGAIDERGLGGLLRGLVAGPQACDAVLRIDQAPTPLSSIRLDSERDDAGLPLADVRWELSAADEDGVRGFVAELVAAFGPQWGTLQLVDEALAPERWTGGGHLRGSARMGTSWRTGVVDRDCAVFGVQNLFLAGSAVVPACGAGDPTLLTLALARRLAAHLAR